MLETLSWCGLAAFFGWVVRDLYGDRTARKAGFSCGYFEGFRDGGLAERARIAALSGGKVEGGNGVR